MDKFDDLLKNFDLEFFGSGKHKISVEAALESFRNKSAVIVDVRAKEEVSYLKFEFAVNIADSEIPDRLDEISRNKTVIVFCSSVVRAAIVYVYLRIKGYDNVKILTADLSEIANCFKPGYILKIVRDT